VTIENLDANGQGSSVAPRADYPAGGRYIDRLPWSAPNQQAWDVGNFCPFRGVLGHKKVAHPIDLIVKSPTCHAGILTPGVHNSWCGFHRTSPDQNLPAARQVA
jgi:hypothetical protein